MSRGKTLFLVFWCDVSVANHDFEDANVAESDGAEGCKPRRAEEHKDEIPRRELVGQIVEAAAR